MPDLKEDDHTSESLPRTRSILRLRPVQVLLAEDDPADVTITIETLRDARSRHELQVVSDGE